MRGGWGGGGLEFGIERTKLKPFHEITLEIQLSNKLNLEEGIIPLMALQ